MSLSEHYTFSCPYCWRENNVEVDFSAGRTQEYIVDCETCCSPIVISVELDGEQLVSLDAKRENG